MRRMQPGPSAITSPRLEKIIHAALKRNLHRPELDWSTYDPSHLSRDERQALAFLLKQMQYTEAISPKNLAMLASATPISALQSAYAGQIHDERAHGEMIARYIELLDEPVAKVHWANLLACDAALIVQRDPVVGAACIMMSIEHYATQLIDALLARIQEPLLHSLCHHILQDEHRHKALAHESWSLLRANGYTTSRLSRARLKAGHQLVRLFFSHMAGPFVARHAGSLGLDTHEIYERAMDEMAPILADDVAELVNG